MPFPAIFWEFTRSRTQPDVAYPESGAFEKPFRGTVALRDLLSKSTPAGAKAQSASERDNFFTKKQKIHGRLVRRPTCLPDSMEARISARNQQASTISSRRKCFNEEEKTPGHRDSGRVDGAWSLEPLLKDPSVSDILCNTYKNIFVERFGLLKPRFIDNAHDEHHRPHHIQGLPHRRILADGRCPLPDGSTSCHHSPWRSTVDLSIAALPSAR
jgi:hypothetical protein